MAAAIGVYLALFVPRNLAPGEVGEVTIIAATREQAVVFKYVSDSCRRRRCCGRRSRS